jgi:hypothetical protein
VSEPKKRKANMETHEFSTQATEIQIRQWRKEPTSNN